MESKHLPKTIEFNRPAKYKALRRLGAGACGETVLIHDENMDCYFVAKKYSPFFSQSESPADFLALFDRFNYEARILFRLNHPNIVRVYSYYDYKEHHTAYILMEYIEGDNWSAPHFTGHVG
ncbi:protein kinase domain-containing protein [Rhizobium sp.]|uniref:protein kinase domain-containing protein n=1 Tax=Rhizobium sp. TaxID=391 RepID=UPI003F7EDC20